MNRPETPKPSRSPALTRRGTLQRLGATALATALPLNFSGPLHAQARPATITTSLSWIPNHQFAGMWVAMEKGYFTDAALKVEWRPGGPNTPNPAERVSSGEVGLGQISGFRGLLDAINKGNDLVVIASRFQRGPGGLMSLAKAPIREPKDILGKRLILPSPVDVRTIETVLRMNKLPAAPNSFTYVPGGFDPAPLLDGQGDAMLVFETNQPLALEDKGMVKNKDFFFRSFDELGFPSYSNVLFGTRKWVADNRDALVRYLRAEIRGWTENEANPAYGAKLAVDKYGAEFNLDLKRETRANILQVPYLHSDDTKANGLFWVNKNRINGPIYDALRAGGMDKLPEVEKYVDMSLLRDAYKR
jgi:ABC-type nitrate/sulfonate/bicarbonate transport system substrate-binding protein